MNISENTALINFNDIKISHIAQMLYADKERKIEYKYFGKKVQRGIMKLHTKYGIMTIRFNEANNWARELELLNIERGA